MGSAEEHSDQQLLHQFKQNGDLSILGKLYQRYISLVYGVSLKYLKNREEAQDAVSHIFEELVRKLAQYEVENFKSWLYVLTKNHCLMYLRKNKHEVEKTDFQDSFMENAEELHPDDNMALEENLQRLEKCISQLRADQRSCVEMFYLEKKCYEEIVEATSFQLKKVKSYIQNGKRNLKICMEEGD